MSGAAQFAWVSLAGAGAGPVLVAVSGLALRHIPMSARVAGLVGPRPRRVRLALAWVLVDETFGLTVAAARRGEPDLVAYKAAVDLLLFSGWVAGTAVGRGPRRAVRPGGLGGRRVLRRALRGPGGAAGAGRWDLVVVALAVGATFAATVLPDGLADHRGGRARRRWPGRCCPMTDLLVVLAMAAVTYGCRVVFLARPGRAPSGRLALFLERFPLALFVALAASTLLVPGETGRPRARLRRPRRRGGRGRGDPAVAGRACWPEGWRPTGWPGPSSGERRGAEGGAAGLGRWRSTPAAARRDPAWGRRPPESDGQAGIRAPGGGVPAAPGGASPPGVRPAGAWRRGASR